MFNPAGSSLAAGDGFYVEPMTSLATAILKVK